MNDNKVQKLDDDALDAVAGGGTGDSNFDVDAVLKARKEIRSGDNQDRSILDRSLNVRPGSSLEAGKLDSDFGGMSPDQVAKSMASQTGTMTPKF